MNQQIKNTYIFTFIYLTEKRYLFNCFFIIISIFGFVFTFFLIYIFLIILFYSSITENYIILITNENFFLFFCHLDIYLSKTNKKKKRCLQSHRSLKLRRGHLILNVSKIFLCSLAFLLIHPLTPSPHQPQ